MPAPRATRWVFALATALVFVTIVLGSVVCATDASSSCPSWPGCYPGRVIPRSEARPLLEGTHRAIAMLAGPAILAAVVAGRRLAFTDARWRVLPGLAFAAAMVSAVLGMVTIKWGLPRAWAVVDLGCALLALMLLAIGTCALHHPGRHTWGAPLVWAAWGTVVLMHLLGVVVAGAGSYTRCLRWPLAWTNHADHWPVLQGVRAGLAVLAAMLLVWLAARRHPWAAAAVALLVVELALGSQVRTNIATPVLDAGCSVVAGLVFAAVTMAVARSTVDARPDAEPAQ